jgi:hypothetical protein
VISVFMTVWMLIPAFSEPASFRSIPQDSNAPVWQDLTPPEDLSGWKVCCGPAKYTVRDGIVTGTTVPGSPNTFLITEKQYGDFELEYEFKVDSRLNAGVQIRSEVIDHRMRGCQIEIDMDENRQRFWSAGIYEEGDRGWLCDLSKNPEAIAAHNIDDWNHVRVVAHGALIETFLNGVPAARTWCGQRLKGVLGLQVHGVGAGQTEPLKVQWRKLRIRDHGEHHWVSLADSSKNSSRSDGEKTDQSFWKVSLPAAAETLKLDLNLSGEQFLNLSQGDLSYEFQAPRRSFRFVFPAPENEREGGAMGGSGSSSGSPWSESRIFLHRATWGVGYEIITDGGPGSSRKMVRFKQPSSAPRRELHISATDGARWQLRVLVPVPAPKSPKKP